jgi:LmbE family N-acetylglucosaminyl deacetylase/Mrp family chromosome partitioning ATPase
VTDLADKGSSTATIRNRVQVMNWTAASPDEVTDQSTDRFSAAEAHENYLEDIDRQLGLLADFVHNARLERTSRKLLVDEHVLATYRLDHIAALIHEMAARFGVGNEHCTIKSSAVNGLARERTVDDIARELQRAGDFGRCIVVVNGGYDAGSISSAHALAQSLARNTRVVLVDLTPHTPGPQAGGQKSRRLGITDLLQGTASFRQIIHRDDASSVHVIESGQLEGRWSEIPGLDRMQLAIDGLVLSYDHVVINASAVPGITIEWLSQLGSCVTLVVTSASKHAARYSRDGITSADAAQIDPVPAAPRNIIRNNSLARRVGPSAHAQAIFIGAHPDDIELGAGGTLIKLIENGWEVFACVVTDESDARVAKIRRQEVLEGARVLGLMPANVFFLGMSDGYVKATADSVEKLRCAVEQRNIRPTLVFTHTYSDCHNDHRAVTELVRAAFRKKIILGFPVLNSLDQSQFTPRFFSDVTRFNDQKLRATELHRSQIAIGRISSIDVDKFTRRLGKLVGYELSEAFDLTEQYGSMNEETVNMIWNSGLFITYDALTRRC